MTQMIPIWRVFPRRTKATPVDRVAFVGDPPLCAEGEPEEVHVSCTFTWDMPEARRLVDAWQFRYPAARVLLGGPAAGSPAGDFHRGLYIQPGYTITSRGCPNRCPHCMVHDREGGIRELPIVDGWNVLDNNLLACSLEHIDAVCEMLRRQPQRPMFTGGLEASLFDVHRAKAILSTRPDRMFFAMDHPNAMRPLILALNLIRDLTGWARGTLRHYVSVYVLVGFDGDMPDEAQRRIARIIDLGPRVFPMFYRGPGGAPRQREWDQLVGGVASMGGAR